MRDGAELVALDALGFEGGAAVEPCADRRDVVAHQRRRLGGKRGEHVLRDVARPFGITEKSHGCAIDKSCVALSQFAEGLLGAG